MKFLVLILAATPVVVQDPGDSTKQANTTRNGTRVELNVSATHNGPGGVNILDAGAPLNVNPVVVSAIQDAGVLNVNFPAVQTVFIATPLNPFLPRCNAVRRLNCQP